MDDSRFLSRSGVPPYTSSLAQALPAEPEAVDEDSQVLITRVARDKELRTWQTTRARLLADIAHLEAHVHDAHVPRAARAFRREIAALDRKLM